MVVRWTTCSPNAYASTNFKTVTFCSEEALARLFTPLYTTKSGGMGLGLYVVQEIVKAHAGTVAVTSTPERGTTFTLHLPLVRDEKIVSSGTL